MVFDWWLLDDVVIILQWSGLSTAFIVGSDVFKGGTVFSLIVISWQFTLILSSFVLIDSAIFCFPFQGDGLNQTND